MADVIISTDSAAISKRLAELTAKVAPIQAIYSDLLSLGVGSPSLADIKALQGDSSEIALKNLVARGKSLTISGVTFSPEVIQLDGALVSSLKTKIKALGNVEYSFYELVEILDGEEEPTGEYAVALVEDAEEIITPGYQLTGPQLAADIIAAMAPIVEGFNEVLDLTNPSPTSPLRDIEQYFQYDLETKRFTTDKHTIVNLVRMFTE